VARGDLIAWLDADDYWDPNHCEVIVPLLERFPEVGVAFSRVRKVGTRNDLWPASPCDHEPHDVFWDCFERTIVPAMSAVSRKEALLRVGLFDERIRIAPDFDLWLRTSRHYRFVSTPQVTSNYRWHESQISRSPARQIRSVFEARLRLATAIREDGDERLAREVEQKALAYRDQFYAEIWAKGDIMLLREVLSWRDQVSIPDWNWVKMNLLSRMPIRFLKRINGNIV
jgi:hypothetical protein